MRKRIVSMFLVLCMVFTLMPTSAFAAETGTPIGTSSVQNSGAPTVCENHKTHDDTCGYIKDAEGAVCTHSCELCKSADGELPTQPKAPKCDCTVQCVAADADNAVEAAINADCPVCGAENADLTACKVAAAMLLGVTPRSANANGTQITQALDFTSNPPADCTDVSIGHTHSGDKCFTWVGDTLTLNSLNLETSAATAIKLPAGAKVNMGAAGSDSTVTSTYDSTDKTYGIYGVGDLTFEGSGTLTVTGGTSTTNSHGVSSDYNITVSGGTLIAASGTGRGNNYGVASNDLTVSGTGSLTGTGGKATGFDSYGVASNRNIIVSETGSLTGIGGQVDVSDNSSIGVLAGGSITVSGGTFEAKSTATTGKTKAVNSKPVTSGYANVKITASTTIGGTMGAYDADNIANYKHIKIEQGAASGAAEITNSSGTTTQYNTLALAVDTVAEGETIKLLADVTEDVTTKNNNINFTLDLNGKTLSGSNTAITYNGKGKLTIKDSSSGGKVTSNGLHTIVSYFNGTIDINGGMVENTNDGGTAIDNTCGTINISGTAAVSATGSVGRAIYNASQYGEYGTINISGTATVSATGSSGTAIYNKADCLITISGGAEITSAANEGLIGTIYLDGGTADTTVLSITDGKVKSTGASPCAGIYNNGAGTVEINGGEISATVGPAGTIHNASTGKINISGGKVSNTSSPAIHNFSTGAINVSGGTVSATGANGIGIKNLDENGTVTISGACTIQGGDKAMDKAPTLGVGVTLTASTDVSGTNPVAYDANKITTYKYIKATAGTTKKITQTLDFTDSGAKPADCSKAPINHNHEGDKCFTWDSGTYTLTLNNIDLEVTEGSKLCGIMLPNATSTVNWNGTNIIKATDDTSFLSHGISSEEGSIILAGDNDTASLTVTSSKATAISFGNGSVTIKRGILTPTGNMYGIAGQLGITVNGGTVTSTGNRNESIRTGNGSISINGGTVTAQTGAGKKPFSIEPVLGANVIHDDATQAWDNTTGDACTYKPSGNTAVTGVTLDKANLTLYSNSNPKTATLTATVAPANASNKGVTWSSDNTSVATVSNGVVTAVGNGTATITVTTTDGNFTATCAVTVSTYSGGGGSSSGGSSGNDSNITVTPPPADKPNTPTQGEIKLDGKVDGNGNATVSITDKNINDAYNKALADAKKNGNESNGITLVLNVDTGNKTANSLTVNLPKTVQDTIISNKIVNTVIVVDSPDIKIGMDLGTVKEINKQANADVNITATKQDSSKLTGSAKTAIGTRPVFDLKVNYGSGKQVTSFGAGSVAVEIPYTLSANEKAGNVQAVYVDANGKVQWLISSVYDSVNKVVRFSTNHFSTYGIGYKTTNTTFTDTANHWAKENIEFVVSRGLFSGTSATTFSPNTAMTRGMFVTALGRLADADVSKYTASSFSDVDSGTYYLGYVEWASKNGIVNGVGEGKFAPDQSIAREQMAVIMQNYAKAIGFTLPKVHAETTFADNANIGTWSTDAVKVMQMAGVISGKDGNKFDPQGTATRAEVSTVLRRFVELAISSDAMQGWTMNDSGKWMYYENGKAVTGKKTIDDTSYIFDQYGVTADVPKNRKNTVYVVQPGDSFWRIAYKQGCTMKELEILNNKSRFSMIHPGDELIVPEE